MQQRSRSETMANLETCYGAFEALAGSLSDDDWATQSLCPDWDSRGIVTHLMSVEHVLTGWRPTGADSTLPFGDIGPFLQSTASWSNEQLVNEAGQLFAARRAELAEMTDEQWAVACPTPVGPARPPLSTS